MKMKKTILLIALIIPLVYGCKKDPDPEPSDPYTLDERARDGLYDLMEYIYLWNDKMPTVKLSDYPGPDDLLDDLRYTPKDRWSFVTGYDEFIASMQGTFVGHGIRMALGPENKVRVVSLYKGSDLWPKEVRRGWIIEKINDQDIAQIFLSGDGAAYNTLMGPSTAGYTNKFDFIKPDGTKISVTSAKASFTINSVTDYRILNLSTGKTGYLAFETFIEPSEQELNEAFAYFKANNISDIIIDLRYNGGGYMSIAQQLSSLILEKGDTTKICYKLKYNNAVAADWNESFKFIRTDSPLGLDRAVFITTRSSASASEVVINSLKPYIQVSLVGDTTHGKPAGMNLWGFPFPTNSNPNPDYEYVFAPITFEYVNSADQGDFYEGMLPDVKANDDITRDWGDPQEASLAAAIALLEGTKAKSSVQYRRVRVFSEGDQLPKNLYLAPPGQFLK